MKKKLRVYTCTDFTGFYPVGVAAVVVSTDPQEAAKALSFCLYQNGMTSHENHWENLTMVELDTDVENNIVVLNDGNY